MTTVQTGLDRIVAGDPEPHRLVRGRRIGLLGHAASVDSRLRPAAAGLVAAGARLSVLFGPEHGFFGSAQDMVGVESERGENLPVYSLYGDDFDDLSPRPEWLDGLDAVVIDLQDVGTRYYTYVWTAVLMLKAAVRTGVEVIVLDRPNPLGGLVVEGAPQRPGYLSFVGLHALPVRHGLTIAEILSWALREEGVDPDALTVVGMKGWKRSMLWADTGLLWVMPSPNMPTPNTALVYPGGCLIEGTTFSEGRGTTRPFEIWGGPDLDYGALRRLNLDGATLRELSFQPMFQKHAGSLCRGVQVHVTDRRVFRSYDAYLRMLGATLPLLPPSARWRTTPYEFVADRPAIDLLTGGPEFRKCVDEDAPLSELLEAQLVAVSAFEPQREQCFLYEK